LKASFQPGPEICGIIQNGEVKQKSNIADNPNDAFKFEEKDLDCAGIQATWHTHPRTVINLSVDDYYFFKSWPHLAHFIISNDSVWCYLIDDQLRVIQVDEEDDLPIRPYGEAAS
jgi:hypothetical protein